MGEKHANSTGSQPNDSSRTERVEATSRIITHAYGFANAADGQKEEEALFHLAELEKCVERAKKEWFREVKTAGEGERSSKTLHGKAAKDA